MSGQQPASSGGEGRRRPGWDVSGTAPDGVIEAIEQPGQCFRMAVQWHPENFWRTGEFRPLFEAFVEAARATVALTSLGRGRGNHVVRERDIEVRDRHTRRRRSRERAPRR